MTTSNPTDKESVAEKLFYADWPNGDWSKYKPGHAAHMKYLHLADVAVQALSPAQGDGMRDAYLEAANEVERDTCIGTCVCGDCNKLRAVIDSLRCKAALASHPDPQPGMTDEQARELLARQYDFAGYPQIAKQVRAKMGNPHAPIAIAAMKRAAAGDRPASQRQR